MADLLLAACGREAPETPAKRDGPPAAPALWRVSDADTTIYVFGTITCCRVAWAAEINRILVAETGVFLMAVGAAHLAGEDSVQRQLEAPGPVAERVR